MEPEPQWDAVDGTQSRLPASSGRRTHTSPTRGRPPSAGGRQRGGGRGVATGGGGGWYGGRVEGVPTGSDGNSQLSIRNVGNHCFSPAIHMWLPQRVTCCHVVTPTRLGAVVGVVTKAVSSVSQGRQILQWGRRYDPPPASPQSVPGRPG